MRAAGKDLSGPCHDTECDAGRRSERGTWLSQVRDSTARTSLLPACIVTAMHRLLAIILLTLASLQLSWATSVPCVQHEGASRLASTSQLAHERLAPELLTAEEAIIIICISVGEKSCDYCQVQAASPVPLSELPILVFGGARLVEAAAVPLRSRGPDRLERPKWHRA